MFLSLFLLILFFALFLPIFFVLIYFNLVTISFTKLGLSEWSVFWLFFFSLVGSFVNIPIYRRKIVFKKESFFWFFFYPPRVGSQIICLNLGGAVIPMILSFYLLPKAPLYPTLISFLIIVIFTKFLAKPVRGVGIAMPAFIPPFLSAILALIFSPHNPVPVAYISGTLGTLVGADLLNLSKLKYLNGQVLSIGGAGVFDGVFLVGVVAAFLA